MVSLYNLLAFPIGASYVLVIIYYLLQSYGSKPMKNEHSGKANITASVLGIKESNVRSASALDQMRSRPSGATTFMITFLFLWPLVFLFLIPTAIICAILSPLTTKKRSVPKLARIERPEKILAKHERKYDIVLFGGTGSCGRGCLEFLSERYLKNKDIKVAVCARNEKKMLRIIDEMKNGWKENDMEVNNWMHQHASVDVLVADVKNIESCRKVVKHAKLVLNTVGPYVKLGVNVIQACCEYGADYVDVTGEFGWIMGMRWKLYDLAVLNGSRIFNACGYDVVPVESSAYLTAAAFEMKFKRPCKNISMTVRSRGGVGGGTLTTVKEIMDHPLEKSPFVGKKSDKKMNYSYSFLNYDSRLFNKWLYIYFFGPVDGHFLKYSNRISGALPAGVKITESSASASFAEAFVHTAMITVFQTLLLIPFLRPLILKFGPAPGKGLGRKMFTRGWFKICSMATDETGQVMVETGTMGDPAYGATCQLAVETAMALLKPEQDNVDLPAPGFYTPIAGLGMGLIRRLYRTETMHVKIS